MNEQLPPRPDRRTAIKWMAAAAASTTIIGRIQSEADAAETPASRPVAVAAKGYGTDPNLLKYYKPGDLWPLTFTDAQRGTAAALCAVIIPAEGKTPSAADLGVQDFIDEWISAPYPRQQHMRPVVLDGLAWIETESQKRFKKPFSHLAATESAAICDDICHGRDAKAEFKKGARFFAMFRDLTAGGFYTTPEGMKDIGYVGNMPLSEFPGPPPEVLSKLGLE